MGGFIVRLIEAKKARCWTQHHPVRAISRQKVAAPNGI
jgi:hypothetical protein